MSEGYRAVCKLTLNGTDIEGHNDFTTLGGEDVSDSFQIHELDWGFESNVSGAAQLAGQTAFRRLRFVKRIDQATPLISQGLAQGQTTEAVCKLFRTSEADGKDRLICTITVTGGRLTGQFVSHRTSIAQRGSGSEQAITHGTQEEVFIAFTTIATAYTGDTSTESEISWTTGGYGG